MMFMYLKYCWEIVLVLNKLMCPSFIIDMSSQAQSGQQKILGDGSDQSQCNTLGGKEDENGFDNSLL